MLKETKYTERSIYGVTSDSSNYGYEKRLKANMLKVADMVDDVDITIEKAGGRSGDAATVEFTYNGKRYEAYFETVAFGRKYVRIKPSKGEVFLEDLTASDVNSWISKFVNKYNVDVRPSLKDDDGLVGWVNKATELNLPGLFMKAIDMVEKESTNKELNEGMKLKQIIKREISKALNEAPLKRKGVALTYGQATANSETDKAIEKYIKEKYPEEILPQGPGAKVDMLGKRGHNLKPSNISKIAKFAKKKNDKVLLGLVEKWIKIAKANDIIEEDTLNEADASITDKFKEGARQILSDYLNMDVHDFEVVMDELGELFDGLTYQLNEGLQNPKKADLNKDGKLSDYEEKRGAAIEKAMQKEDLDLGHQDDEPNMLRKDLYRIAKYASELGDMVEPFDNFEGEVDFPHWWQTKITKAKDMLISAKHYLDGELKVNPEQIMEEEEALLNGDQILKYLLTDKFNYEEAIEQAKKLPYREKMATLRKIRFYLNQEQ